MERANAKALKRMAAMSGYDWSDEECERLLPQVERTLEIFDTLGVLAVRDVEPALQYRIL